jgi:copper homeostasis protein
MECCYEDHEAKIDIRVDTSDIIFELCAETLEACLAAGAGGANRVELCAALMVGGLTPSQGFVKTVVSKCSLPVHAMIRPRGGNFVYSAPELMIMRADITRMKELGVTGVVLGLLHADYTVDVDATREFVKQARPLKVTFHRAFDEATDLAQALEDVIAAGCDRILTCGGSSDVYTGATKLAELREQAAGRIEVAAGGGLRLETAADVARQTGLRHFHGSMREWIAVPKASEEPSRELETPYVVKAQSIRAMIEALRSGACSASDRCANIARGRPIRHV